MPVFARGAQRNKSSAAAGTMIMFGSILPGKETE